MTLLIKLPGTLTDTTGLPRLITTTDGFPDGNLTDLFLFEDGSGTSPDNSVVGRDAGLIEAPVASNNAYSWLSGGGLSLSGTQLMTAPVSDASTPWSIVSAGAFVGSVGGTASERIAGVMGHKQAGLAFPYRGAHMYARGGNDWNSGVGPGPYQARKTDAGNLAGGQPLLPSGLNENGDRRLRILSYDGSSTITAIVYDKNGAVVSSVSFAATDAEMFTSSGVTVTDLNPCLGIPSATYNGGIHEVEAFAVYAKELDSAEISTILATCVALGAARGRGW